MNLGLCIFLGVYQEARLEQWPLFYPLAIVHRNELGLLVMHLLEHMVKRMLLQQERFIFTNLILIYKSTPYPSLWIRR